MNIHSIRSILAIVLFVLMAACSSGGGGDGGGLTLASLQGTWYGTFRDDSAIEHTIQVIADNQGNITSISVDNQDLGYGGTISQVNSTTFRYVLDDSYQTEGGFLLDSSGNHMAFADWDYSFGVMQKGASSLPSFALSDINGSWSGYSIELDQNLNIVESYSSQITVDTATYSYTGSNKFGTFNGYVAYMDEDWGFALGDWQSDDNPSIGGLINARLSVDKTFFGAWACDSGSSDGILIYYIEDCSLSMWNKR